jgi:hypothetical protein
MNAIERITTGYKTEKQRTEQDLAIGRGQLNDFESRLGKPFEHAAYMDELSQLRDRLRVSLSGNVPEGAAPASEVAEKIKALRAANTVEAAPQRVGTRKAVAAEKPVTTRIRETIAEKPTEEPQDEAVAVIETPIEPEPEPVVIKIPEPVKPDHRDQVTKRRNGKEAQLWLF